MAYEVIILDHLNMPLYFLGTFTEYPYLKGEVFGELLDKEKFVQYGLTRVTIEWANGADLAPEFLYEIGTVA